MKNQELVNCIAIKYKNINAMQSFKNMYELLKFSYSYDITKLKHKTFKTYLQYVLNTGLLY